MRLSDDRPFPTLPSPKEQTEVCVAQVHKVLKDGLRVQGRLLREGRDAGTGQPGGDRV